MSSKLIQNGVESSGLIASGFVVSTNSTTISGPTLFNNLNLKIMFTANITGSNGTTPLALTYNGTSIAIKAVNNGQLVDMFAHNVDSAYKYIQAYTTMELIYDGTQFIVVGNPLVLSSATYSIYANGQIGDTPLGTIIPQYVKTNLYGYLYCDGRDTTGTSEELRVHYPRLYAYMGETNKVPDYREFVLVGAEQNTTSAEIAPDSHDVYTVAQEKNDCLQGHWHTYLDAINEGQVGSKASVMGGPDVIVPCYGGDGVLYRISNITTDPSHGAVRLGKVTRGKRKAVYFYIKAM